MRVLVIHNVAASSCQTLTSRHHSTNLLANKATQKAVLDKKKREEKAKEKTHKLTPPAPPSTPTIHTVDLSTVPAAPVFKDVESFLQAKKNGSVCFQEPYVIEDLSGSPAWQQCMSTDKFVKDMQTFRKLFLGMKNVPRAQAEALLAAECTFSARAHHTLRGTMALQ